MSSLTPQRLEEAAAWSTRLSDRPSSRDDVAFLAWLAADPGNREAFEALSSTLDDVEHFAGAPEMLKLREAALTDARRSHGMLRTRAFSSSRLPWVAVIVLAIIGAIGAGVWYLERSTAFETLVAERRAVALPDGSHISLDAATQVKLDYSSDRRRVVLARGRAKFDVARDPLRPFTVEAGSKVVVATGTSFSIELLDHEVRVILYEGHVEILPARRIAEHPGEIVQPDITLSPGQELVASTTESFFPTHVAAIDVSRSLSWEGGDLAFEDEPLSIAVARVNRYLENPIHIADAKAGDVRISGVFHAGDIDAFIDGVTTLFPVRAQRDKDGTALVFAPRPRH